MPSTHHLLVPQTVYEGGHHRSENGTKHKKNLGQLGTVVRIRLHANQHSWAKIENQHSQVGGTGGQGFVPGLRGVHAEDSKEDKGIRGHDEGQGDEEHRDACHHHSLLIGRDVFTGQFQDGHDLTEEMGNLFGTTAGEIHGSSILLHMSIYLLLCWQHTVLIYYSFVIYFEIRKYDASIFVFLSEDCFVNLILFLNLKYCKLFMITSDVNIGLTYII